jgi:hypothetical protein
MGGVTVALQSSVNHRLSAEQCGVLGAEGAKIKVFLITLPASYNQTTTHGSALSLASHFKSRVYWAIPVSPFFINDSTGAVCIGLVPGTAKTDRPGGFKVSDWKVRAFATATESTNAADLSLYTGYIMACGV